jgi:hypothetical protein
MTLGADVPFGPRRRERLFDMDNPAGWVGFNDPNVTASTDDMTVIKTADSRPRSA